MATKYAREIKRARQRIIAKGALCIWYKPGEPKEVNDPTPEFEELNDAKPYENTPIVTYPSKRVNQETVRFSAELASGTEQLFALIPGDVPFTPEENDAVLLNGEILHVGYINTTKPDGTPIVHEIGFKA